MVKFSEEEMKCAYKEVYYIIEFLDEDIKEMIPNEKIEFYKSHMDNTHSFRYDYKFERIHLVGYKIF